jgi:hypothetical protein
MSGNEPKITNRFIAMTPREIYLQRVKASYDSFRYTTAGKDYIPPSFGGLFGQQTMVNYPNVLELIEFESN